MTTDTGVDRASKLDTTSLSDALDREAMDLAAQPDWAGTRATAGPAVSVGGAY